MYRQIEDTIRVWKDKRRRKPIVLRGARQVGKTHTVTSVGRQHFDSLVRIDFERDSRAHAAFEGDLSPGAIIPRLELFANARIVPGTTLLFLDEIQACPRALKSLRYFKEELPELHVISAGSLLEFAMGTQSFPVGSVEFAWMRPMCLREFLYALGEDLLIEHLPSLDTQVPVDLVAHARLTELLKAYFVVGGMPEAVARYAETRSFLEVSDVHRNLVQSYTQDLNKYRGRMELDGADELLKRIPARVGQQAKYTALQPYWRIEKIRRALELLERILLIERVRSSPAHGIPLSGQASDKVFKLLFLDIGLMRHQCGIDAGQVLGGTDMLHSLRGALAEQFVGQELLCAGGCENGRLFYWSRPQKSSSAELDYVCVRAGCILPVEVKSGFSRRSKSLGVFFSEHPTCRKAIVLSPGNVSIEQDGRVIRLPLYTRLSNE